MSHVSPPPVTLEDLQAFQSKHFPGNFQPTQTNNEPYRPYNTDKGDGTLGYYPDGVKRTLTDEQIRIFRHSEIHSLLRERQLKEEEDDFSRRFTVPSEAISIEEQMSSKEGKTHSELPNDQIKQDTKNTGIKSTTDRAEPRESGSKRHTAAMSNELLDYNEEGAAQQPARKHAASQFPGRRIISYDD